MGVDGISGAGSPKAPDAPGKVGSDEGASFAVDRTSEPTVPSELDRVASGELSAEQYLDARVEQATTHLDAIVNAEQLAAIRAELREQLSADPVLQRLVQRSLGTSAPEPSR